MPIDVGARKIRDVGVLFPPTLFFDIKGLGGFSRKKNPVSGK